MISKKKNTKKRITRKAAKGYKDDDDLYNRIQQNIICGVTYKGYKGLMDALSLPIKKDKPQRDKQKEALQRFFSWQEISTGKWIITEIYDEPVLDMTETKSIYGDSAAKVIAKEIYDRKNELEINDKALEFKGEGSIELMLNSRAMGHLVGVPDYRDYTPLNECELTPIQAEEYKDMTNGNYYDQIRRDLEIKKEVVATNEDIDQFIKQFSSRRKAVITHNLNDLKFKNILNYVYTDLYQDLRTGRADVLIRHKSLTEKIAKVRDRVMDKYNIHDEREIFYKNHGMYRAEYYKDLTKALREELKVKVFSGYYILIRPKKLEEYCKRKGLEALSTDNIRKGIYERVCKRQQVGAIEFYKKYSYLCDKGLEDLIDISDDYTNVSQALIDMMVPYHDVEDYNIMDMFLPMQTLDGSEDDDHKTTFGRY